MVTCLREANLLCHSRYNYSDYGLLGERASFFSLISKVVLVIFVAETWTQTQCLLVVSRLWGKKKKKESDQVVFVTAVPTITPLGDAGLSGLLLWRNAEYSQIQVCYGCFFQLTFRFRSLQHVCSNALVSFTLRTSTSYVPSAVMSPSCSKGSSVPE